MSLYFLLLNIRVLSIIKSSKIIVGSTVELHQLENVISEYSRLKTDCLAFSEFNVLFSEILPLP